MISLDHIGKKNFHYCKYKHHILGKVKTSEYDGG